MSFIRDLQTYTLTWECNTLSANLYWLHFSRNYFSMCLYSLGGCSDNPTLPRTQLPASTPPGTHAEQTFSSVHPDYSSSSSQRQISVWIMLHFSLSHTSLASPRTQWRPTPSSSTRHPLASPTNPC